MKKKLQGDIFSQFNDALKILRVEESHLSPEDRLALWNKVAAATIRRHAFRVWRWRAVGVVAAASVLLCVGMYLFMSEKDGQGVDYELIAKQIDFNGSRNIRILSEDEVVDITGENAEVVYDKQGNANLSSGEVKKIAASAKPARLVVPYGKTSSVLLSDGTKMWVNSGSCVIYPPAFTGNKREIYVEGEIYLEVSKNDRLPFIVKTDKLDVCVHGTAFNVQAYKGDVCQSVVLVTGSVSVTTKNEKAIRMEPNQKYDYDLNTRSAKLEEVDIYDYICWKFGFLHFKSEKLQTVLNRLEKYYNIPIVCDSEALKAIEVSGKLDLKEGVADVLNVVALTAHFRLEQRQDAIHIIKQ